MQRPGAAHKAEPRVPLETEELMGCRLRSWLGAERGEKQGVIRDLSKDPESL